jgi:GT2 family glycosyltransferase
MELDRNKNNNQLSFLEKLINAFWRRISPFFMKVRDVLIACRIIKHNFRQPYHLGYLDPSKTEADLLKHLHAQGFSNHFFAWDDPGQKYSLRRRTDFKFQYHLRIFSDGEIRGHYEWTPEAHPIRHLQDLGMQPQTEEFTKFLQGWIVHQKRNLRPMKVSFVIPAYNEEAFIRNCILSILSQKINPNYEVEIIVVNNASTDRTKEIAQAFVQVQVIDEPKKGLPYARQAGFLAATGDIIAQLDADSKLTPGWIAKVVEKLQNDEKLIGIGGPNIYEDISVMHRLVVGTYYFFGFLVYWINRHVFKISSMVQGSNFAVRRNALEKIGGYNTKISFYGEDTDLAKRLNKLGPIIFTFDLPIYTSSRRFKSEGLIKVGYRYLLNYLSIVYLNRQVSHEYSDIRDDSSSS